MDWSDAAFKVIMVSGIGVGLSQFWLLKGKMDQFINGQWGRYLKKFDEVHQKVHSNSERLARLEGGK